MSSWSPGPVVTRRRLGGELRRLRDRSGMKLEEIARALECSPSKISRLENGKGIPKARDVRDMLDAYGVRDEAVRTRLLDWASTGQAKMWWQDYLDLLPQGLATYLELEWDASRIHAYESHVVHGLLQTPDYARAVLTTAWEHRYTPTEIDRLVDVRLARQDALRADHGLDLHCVLDESALYRVVGSRDVLRGQIDRLVELAAADHIDVRVLPFSAGLVLPSLGSFSKLEFSTGIEDGLVYVESSPTSSFLTEPAEIALYDERLGAILGVALTEASSVPLMQYAARRI